MVVTIHDANFARFESQNVDRSISLALPETILTSGNGCDWLESPIGRSRTTNVNYASGPVAALRGNFVPLGLEPGEFRNHAAVPAVLTSERRIHTEQQDMLHTSLRPTLLSRSVKGRSFGTSRTCNPCIYHPLLPLMARPCFRSTRELG